MDNLCKKVLFYALTTVHILEKSYPDTEIVSATKEIVLKALPPSYVKEACETLLQIYGPVCLVGDLRHVAYS